ncbi:MAG: UPF0182 family protein [Fimbriimonadaceae bacterium]
MRIEGDENVITINQDQRDQDSATVRKQMRFGCGCFSIIALAILLMAVVVPYTDFLWFTHDARQPAVFTTGYSARAKLFAFAFIPILIGVYFSLSRALNVAMVYLKMPSTRGEQLVTHAIAFVKRFGSSVTKIAAVLTAFSFAAGFSAEWMAWLVAMQGGEFGVKDPTFGKDVGFFVFDLPWQLVLSNLIFGILLLTTVLTIGIYVGLQVLASLAKVELSRPFVRMHVCLLIGLTILAFALQLWLRRYEAGLSASLQFTGAGYAGMQRLGAETLMAWLVALFGVGVIVNGRVGRPFGFAVGGGVSIGLLYVLSVFAWPTFVQKFQVEPNKLTKEKPFAEHAIKMTRFAYGLDKIELRDTEVTARPTQEEIAASRSTLENMRLWDPEVLKQSLEGIQSLKPYYTFNDVDLDRYMIGGKQTMVMLSPRDLNLNGLSPDAQTWVNTRLSYTHGYGVAMAPVNQVGPTGQPSFIMKDIPPKTPPELPLNQPRIYFSDFLDDFGGDSGNYALVNSGAEEFDFPGRNNEQKTTRWSGDRGVPVGSLLTKLAYSLSLKDGNMLVSGSITPDTRLIYRRNVLERASLVYPFLRFDQDPYIVVLDGKIIWIADGYTVTGRIPYSARISGDRERINYIRNPVKVTIDAYSGETKAYAIDPAEPILKAYRGIYPGLVRDASEMPKGIREHLRYPEDMFNLQAAQLTLYHVQDPIAFLQNQDAWDIALERDLNGNRAMLRPYYVQMKLPDEDREGFMLILPFTPRSKNNMSGWLSADCDPDKYGRLVLYRYQGQSLENIAGPEQMENRFNTDPKIAQINLEFGANRQSEIIVGNLLVMPIGRSVMYIEPLFLKSVTPGSPPIPELKKVILAFSDKIVVADTYQEALAELLGDIPAVKAMPVPPRDGVKPPPEAPSAGGQVSKADLQEAVRLLDEADAALRAGDFARYGTLQKKARARLQELFRR